MVLEEEVAVQAQINVLKGKGIVTKMLIAKEISFAEIITVIKHWDLVLSMTVVITLTIVSDIRKHD